MIIGTVTFLHKIIAIILKFTDYTYRKKNKIKGAQTYISISIFLISSGKSVVLVGLIVSVYQTCSENRDCNKSILCIGCKSELHTGSLFHFCGILLCYLKVLWGLLKQELTLQICSVFSERKEHFNKPFLFGYQRSIH